MDYDSPGAYKKNKLTVHIVTQTGVIFRCDKCGRYPDNLVLILRGGYVQEQLCLECGKGVAGLCSTEIDQKNQ